MAQRRQARKLPRLQLAMKSEGDYQSCASRLKALADPDRLRIVNSLLRGEKNVSELAQQLGLGMVKVSHHLGVLRSANVVQTHKEGKFVIYALHPEIASAGKSLSGMKTLDLGCCRLDLAQPKAAR
jgi:DNA-binding transcriptional ArsR family regulator